ncbi:hypothetical protein L198_00094 [Cryptococcus wingfieldii CBS 7118]|uniref:WSC domain-containing protein n=1 Tax=Cryptococcus wingfieldii CBS 7118 TaxID=1295528 RepID=A0A1E3K5K4_9TREE|nr:hypothetical protein L198_00094 [Cryptococcus wingfieldii CBS 7118]ODO08369.1 hypothetical protein L198_00094 [Cryptococcus wingfieldii CBS 7118]
MSPVISLLLLASLVNGAAVHPHNERRFLWGSWSFNTDSRQDSSSYWSNSNGWGNSDSTFSTTSPQAATYLAQAQSGVSGLHQGWSAAGCYDDSFNARTLASASTSSWWMTYSTCTTFCGNRGYTYSGVESSNCYCSNSINSASSIQPYYKCSGICGGNWFEDCPRTNYINVFTNSKTTTSSSTAKTSSTFSPTSTSIAKVSITSPSASGSTMKSSVPALASSSSTAAESSIVPIVDTSVISAAQTIISSAVSSVASEASQVVSSVSAQLNTTSVASQIQSVPSQVSSAIPAINTTSVVSQLQSVASSVVSSVEAVPTSVASSVISEVSSIASGASTQVIPAVANTTSSVASDIANATSAVSSIYSETTEAASSTVSSVASDISSAFSEESSAVSTIAEIASSVTSSAAAAASSAVSSLPTGWEVSACIAEGTSGRALPETSTSSSDMTQSMCASFCSDAGYTLAAIEYASECWCSDLLQNGASLTETSSACTMSCSGDSDEICGGPSALTLIVNTSAIASLNDDLTAGIVILPTNWSVPSTSCIPEASSGRALTGSSYTSPDMTLATCASYCTSEGYGIAGVEYSTECYCSNMLSNGVSLNDSSSSCTMTCGGDGTTFCGGSGALSIAVSSTITSKLSSDLTTEITTLPTGWSAASSPCISEVTSGRALAHASTASDDMTIETCLDFCNAAGWQYAGIEYGRECYCGDYLANGASLDLTATCNTACAGDDMSICGGGNALSLYVNPSLALDLTVVLGYHLQGCVQEVTGRLLANSSYTSSNMTVDACVGFCSDEGLSLAGVEYGEECYCSSALTSSPLLSTECNMACAGDDSQNCGGADAIELYLAAGSVLSVL